MVQAAANGQFSHQFETIHEVDIESAPVFDDAFVQVGAEAPRVRVRK
jgi:hypothetical protein